MDALPHFEQVSGSPTVGSDIGISFRRIRGRSKTTSAPWRGQVKAKADTAGRGLGGKPKADILTEAESG